MKKTDFIKTVAQTLLEFYPAGGYRVTMDDMKKNVAPKSMTEYDAQSPESPENQENPEYYEQPRQPQPAHGIGKFNHIDWRAAFDSLVDNTKIMQKASDAPQGPPYYHTDFTDAEEGMFTNEELALLENADIISIDNGVPIIENEQMMNYDAFRNAALQAWNNPPSPSQTSGDDSESPYLRGYEPMSETKLHEIYSQFKHIIKEEINEVAFNEKIRGVFYEYADGVAETTPTTEDPVRDPEAAADRGEKMKEVGQTVKDASDKIKQIKSRPSPVPIAKSTTDNMSIREYVEENMLPAIVEIIKNAENPRSTKKELMEMFKMNKKLNK